MFWPLVLPATIAFWGLLTCVVVATALAPRFKFGRLTAFVLSSLVAWIAFVPAMIALKAAMDPFRFGRFHYASYGDVDDWRVYRYLPEGVTNVTLEKPAHGNGFRAKFSIAQAELESWVDEQWRRYGAASSEFPRSAIDKRRLVGEEELSHEFDDFGEPLPSDAVEYGGPVAPNGAGFTIWYNAEQGVGFERAGYW